MSACSKEVVEENIEVYSPDEEIKEKEVVIENDNFEFHFFPKTTQFYIVKKSNGFIWRSNPEDTSDQGDSEKSWIQR